MIYYISTKRKRPYGQAVKTTPSHGVNPGSSPGKVTTSNLNRTPQLEGERFGLFHYNNKSAMGRIL